MIAKDEDLAVTRIEARQGIMNGIDELLANSEILGAWVIGVDTVERGRVDLVTERTAPSRDRP